MAKPPRGSKTPGEMCSYDPKTGLYTDRWLWDEILGEHPTEPNIPPNNLSSALPDPILRPQHPPPNFDD